MQNVDSRANLGESSDGSGRLHYLDWIRVIAVLGVFVYHTSQPFDIVEFSIKNAEQTPVITAVYGFMYPFTMPLFFLVAGIGSWLSLRRRSGRQYLVERISRLLIPFIVGSAVLTPVSFYFEARHLGWFNGSLPDWLAQPGTILALLASSRPITPGPLLFGTVGVHLWFVGYLFSYSLLALPLFLWLKQGAGRRFLDWLGRLGERRGGLLWFALPMVVMRLILQPYFPESRDWSEFVFMGLFFIAGYIVWADGRLRQAIGRDRRLSLVLGIASYAVLLPAAARGVVLDWMEIPGTAGFVLFWSALSLGGWCWSIFLLWRAMHALDYETPWLRYWRRAAMPFYVLHHPVVVVLAYYVVQQQANLWLKWLVVLLGSYVVSRGLTGLVLRFKLLGAASGVKR
jgi:glucan biosynthesis protein C